MSGAKEVRMSRIFREDRKALVVAMDHGSFMPVSGFEKPKKTLELILDGGADAIMTTFGISQLYGAMIAKNAGLILRLDGGTTVLGPNPENISQLFSVEDALKVGADAVICMGYVGSDRENETMRYLSRISGACKNWGVPLLAEMLLQGKDKTSVSGIKLATRVGAELGADFIKAQYTGDPKTFREITDNCFVPILVLGGPKMKNDEDVLTTVKGAMEGGAAGVCMGRNIWQHKDPKKITSAIARIIHEDYSVKEALKGL